MGKSERLSTGVWRLVWLLAARKREGGCTTQLTLGVPLVVLWLWSMGG